MSDKVLGALLGFLGLVLVGVVGVGLFIYTNDEGHWTLNPTPTVTSTPSPTITGAASLMRVQIPADSSCSDCHKAGSVNLPNVPPLGHPLQGWANCSSCHGQKKLVTTAPGHRGIHKDQCLLCHAQANAETVKATPRRHHLYPGKSCTDCHKPGGTGPLPQTMVGRKNCWVCHVSAKNEDLFSETTSTS